MTLRLPMDFTFYRVPSQTGGLRRAAQFELPRTPTPPQHVFSAALTKAVAEAKARGELGT